MISRHKTDAVDVRERLELTEGEFDFFIDAALRDPNNLSLLFENAQLIASCRHYLGLADQLVREPFEIALNCGTALCMLGCGRPISDGFTLAPSRKPNWVAPSVRIEFVDLSLWLTSVSLAVLFERWDVVEELSKLPLETIYQRDGSQPEYFYHLCQAFSSFFTEEGDFAESIGNALEMCDPNSPNVIDPDWTLFIDVPMIQFLYHLYLAEHDQVIAGLEQALQFHKRYWSSTPELSNRTNGLVSLRISAIAKILKLRNIPLEIESDYLVLADA